MAEKYKLLLQSQAQEINPAGTGFIPVWNITFEITTGPAKGTVATVQVGQEDHNGPAVAREIAAVVQHATDVAALGG